MFRTVPLYIIRSFFTVHTAMVYVIQVMLTVYEQKILEISVSSWFYYKNDTRNKPGLHKMRWYT